MPNRPPNLPVIPTLGKRIVYWREQRKLTRSQLAKLAKMPYSTLAGIESDDQEGSTRLTQIAAALRINPHYLATDRGDPEDLTVAAPAENTDWPFPFDRSELAELDPIELELATLKFQKVLEDIRAKRPRQKSRKAS